MTVQTLGHYRIIEKIGFGGMGDVYRASDEQLGREVAIKLLKPELASDQDRLRRFQQEARAAAALNHENIVAVYDSGVHEGLPYIVSELLHGDTLRERLKSGPIPVRQAADYATQIVEGLSAAHAKGIVHRDLKPENLFITKEGRVKILDFGIAKLISRDAVHEHSVDTMTTQTKSGSLLGTVAYMSPEQLRARPVDHRSDIFSFGAILFEMLTGNRAFAGDTEVDTMTAVLKDDPPEISLPGQSAVTAYDQIVHHCLEKDPENRFQSARDLSFALSAVANLPTSRHRLPAFNASPRRWPLWLAIAALLIAAGGLIGKIAQPAASAPIYRRVTFERGTVYSARFTSDGQSLVYGAAWNGRPLQIYFAPADSVSARSLDFTSASLLAVSRSNELSLVLGGSHGSRLEFVGGMLARAPLAGGAPREMLSDVRFADWSPSGELALVQHLNGHNQLEYPIGKVLYETSGWISDLRFSPAGDRIAFLDHPALYDDRGSVSVMDLSGKRMTLSSGWEAEDGLAWSAKGDEVWFTAAERGSNRALWAVSLSGKKRSIASVPGAFTLQDIAPDGRVLVTLNDERLAMEWTGEKEGDVRDLSWYDWSIAKDISENGPSVLFEEGSEPAGANYAVSIRKVDGSLPTRLGDGSVGGLSPDGKWAVSVFTGKPEHLTLLPVGSGQPRDIPLPGLDHLQNGSAHFMPDGKSLVVNGNEPGRPGRSYIVEFDGGKLRPVTPEGIYASVPSPDGKDLVGAGADQKLMLFPVAGGAPQPIHGLDPSFAVAQWSADSRSLFVYRPGEVPLEVYRFDLATGKMTPVRELIPPDRTGVVSIAPVVTNLQGTEFAYSYLQNLSVLYVISGLK
jgi:eukaryotic-like serine/threonine-protein kinase